MPANSYPYRVFVSFAREDEEYARQIVTKLEHLELQPVWFPHNCAGTPLVDGVKNQIDHCHLFIELRTPQSVRSPWVNHEIGYALARDLPVFPMSLGSRPRGMTSDINPAEGSRIEDVLLKLTRPVIDQLVKDAKTAAVYKCADLSQTRTGAIIEHCKKLDSLRSNYQQRIRHRAAFGSFSLPFDPDDPIWLDRYDDRRPNRHDFERLSTERQELEKHASQFGCDLILYPTLPDLSERAIRARKKVLQLFLERMGELDVRVRVVFHESALKENLIIVGDWFLVESLTPTPEGFRHTTITSHAPTVLRQIETFDRRFDRFDWLGPDEAIRRLDDEF